MITSSASVSLVFVWEQFSAEKGYEGSRTYVYATAASSQPKRANDFFFSFPLKWQLAVYRLQTTIKAAEFFHPSVFTPAIFAFLYYYYDFAVVRQRMPCLKNHLPAPVRPAVPRQFGAALQQARFHQAAPTGDRQCDLLLVHRQDKKWPLSHLASVSTLVPHVPELHTDRVRWRPASHRIEAVVLSAKHLKELFFSSLTNFAYVQGSSRSCVSFLSHWS